MCLKKQKGKMTACFTVNEKDIFTCMSNNLASQSEESMWQYGVCELVLGTVDDRYCLEREITMTAQGYCKHTV